MDVGAHLAATEHQNKGLIAMIVPPHSRHVTTLRVKRSLSPVNGPRSPRTRGGIGLQVNFCSMRWRYFGLAKRGRPRPVPSLKQAVYRRSAAATPQQNQ